MNFLDRTQHNHSSPLWGDTLQQYVLTMTKSNQEVFEPIITATISLEQNKYYNSRGLAKSNQEMLAAGAKPTITVITFFGTPYTKQRTFPVS